MVINDSVGTIQVPTINPYATSWISWTEQRAQAAATTAGVVVSAGAEVAMVTLGTAMIGLIPAALLGVGTYYWLFKKCYAQTAAGLCSYIQRSLDDFEKQFMGDDLVVWQTDADLKAFVELNFYGSIKDCKEHLRQRMKKLAVIRTYLQVAINKAQNSSLCQSCNEFVERLNELESDTMMKFRRVCDYDAAKPAQGLK